MRRLVNILASVKNASSDCATLSSKLLILLCGSVLICLFRRGICLIQRLPVSEIVALWRHAWHNCGRLVFAPLPWEEYMIHREMLILHKGRTGKLRLPPSLVTPTLGHCTILLLPRRLNLSR